MDLMMCPLPTFRNGAVTRTFCESTPALDKAFCRDTSPPVNSIVGADINESSLETWVEKEVAHLSQL